MTNRRDHQMPAAPETRGDSDRLDPLIWKITAVAVIGSFMAQLDAAVVNVSLSSLAAELRSSLAGIQWVTSGYLLALALTPRRARCWPWPAPPRSSIWQAMACR